MDHHEDHINDSRVNLDAWLFVVPVDGPRINMTELKRRRLARGLSQLQLANLANMYQADVSRIEGGSKTGRNYQSRLMEVLGPNLFDSNGFPTEAQSV